MSEQASGEFALAAEVEPPALKLPGKKIGLALGSGSARGWAHIGVIRALDDAGITPDVISGSSIGALVGAGYVTGRLPELERWVKSLTRWKMVRFVDVTFSSGAIVDGERLRQELSEVIGEEDMLIEDLPTRYAAVATNLYSGREKRFTEGSLHDAIWSSAAIPGILPPVNIDAEWYVDGGVVNPVPVNLCRYMDADLVIAVNLNGNIIGRKPGMALVEPELEEMAKNDSFSKIKQSIMRHPLYPFPPEEGEAAPKSPGMLETFADAINIMQERLTRSRMVGDPPDVLISPHLADIGMMDFTRAQEGIDAGYAAAERLMPEIKYRLALSQ